MALYRNVEDDDLVEAMYDNQAEADDELEFFKGDHIQVTSKNEAEWWYGHIVGYPDISGFFPTNYVKRYARKDLIKRIEAKKQTQDDDDGVEQDTQEENGLKKRKPNKSIPIPYNKKDGKRPGNDTDTSFDEHEKIKNKSEKRIECIDSDEKDSMQCSGAHEMDDIQLHRRHDARPQFTQPDDGASVTDDDIMGKKVFYIDNHQGAIVFERGADQNLNHKHKRRFQADKNKVQKKTPTSKNAPNGSYHKQRKQLGDDFDFSNEEGLLEEATADFVDSSSDDFDHSHQQDELIMNDARRQFDEDPKETDVRQHEINSAYDSDEKDLALNGKKQKDKKPSGEVINDNKSTSSRARLKMSNKISDISSSLEHSLETKNVRKQGEEMLNDQRSLKLQPKKHHSRSPKKTRMQRRKRSPKRDQQPERQLALHQSRESDQSSGDDIDDSSNLTQANGNAVLTKNRAYAVSEANTKDNKLDEKNLCLDSRVSFIDFDKDISGMAVSKSAQHIDKNTDSNKSHRRKMEPKKKIVLSKEDVALKEGEGVNKVIERLSTNSSLISSNSESVEDSSDKRTSQSQRLIGSMHKNDSSKVSFTKSFPDKKKISGETTYNNTSTYDANTSISNDISKTESSNMTHKNKQNIPIKDEKTLKQQPELSSIGSIRELKNQLANAKQHQLDVENRRQEAERALIKQRAEKNKIEEEQRIARKEAERIREELEGRLMSLEDKLSTKNEKRWRSAIVIQSCGRMYAAKKIVYSVRRAKQNTKKKKVLHEDRTRTDSAKIESVKNKLDKCELGKPQLASPDVSNSASELTEEVRQLVATLVRQELEEAVQTQDEILVQMQSSLQQIHDTLLIHNRILNGVPSHEETESVEPTNTYFENSAATNGQGIRTLPQIAKPCVLSPKALKNTSNTHRKEEASKLPTLALEEEHHSGFKYEPCKTTIYAPSKLAADRAHGPQLPSTRLQLEHVYGYQGHIPKRAPAPSARNIFVLSEHQIAYPASCVVVLYDMLTSQQNFYLGHDDVIQSLTLHPNRTVFASAQGGHKSRIDVWEVQLEDVRDSPGTFNGSSNGLGVCLAHLEYHQMGVNALGFSANGQLLVSLGADDYHMVVIWHWRSKRILTTAKGFLHNVRDIAFNPSDVFLTDKNEAVYGLVSCGVGHIKFWHLSQKLEENLDDSLDDKEDSWKLLSHEGKHPDNTIIDYSSICYVALRPRDASESTRNIDGYWLAGTERGDIYIWKQKMERTLDFGKCVHLLSVIDCAHQCWIQSIAYNTRSQNLATCDANGVIKCWNAEILIKLDPRAEGLESPRLIDLGKNSLGTKTSPRCITWMENDLVVGCTNNEIALLLFKLSHQPTLPLVSGHCGRVEAIAAHPSKNWFLSVDHEAFLSVWDGASHKLLSRTVMRAKALALCMHPHGTHVAVSLEDGQLMVLEIVVKEGYLSDEPWSILIDKPLDPGNVKKSKTTDFQKRFPNLAADSESIATKKKTTQHTLLRYSPDGKRLAVVVANTMTIFSVESKKYRRLSTCHGHTSTIMAFDWACDGAKIQTNDQTHQIFYWDAVTGKQIHSSEAFRDEKWASWTGHHGWPVQGLWSPKDKLSNTREHQSTDKKTHSIHCVERSLDGKEIAVAHESNEISLYRYPCLSQAARRTYRVHNSAVRGFAFVGNNAYMVSIEAKEPILYQWRCISDE